MNVSGCSEWTQCPAFLIVTRRPAGRGPPWRGRTRRGRRRTRRRRPTAPARRTARGPQAVLGPAADLPQLLPQGRQVDLPPPPVVLAPQVLQQEAPHGGVAHRLAQRPSASSRRSRVVRSMACMAAMYRENSLRVLVADRRHVDHDEPVHALGVEQRGEHRDLAAHRVAHQRHRLRPQHAGDPVGGVEEVEVGGPGRAAVVGQVHEQHPVVGQQGLGDLGPVRPWPKRPWQNTTGGPCSPSDVVCSTTSSGAPALRSRTRRTCPRVPRRRRRSRLPRPRRRRRSHLPVRRGRH